MLKNKKEKILFFLCVFFFVLFARRNNVIIWIEASRIPSTQVMAFSLKRLPNGEDE